MRLAEDAAELQCEVQKTAILELPPTFDDKDNVNNDSIYDGFVTKQNDPADCLKTLSNSSGEQFNKLVDLMSETMYQKIYSEKGEKCMDFP